MGGRVRGGGRRAPGVAGLPGGDGESGLGPGPQGAQREPPKNQVGAFCYKRRDALPLGACPWPSPFPSNCDFQMNTPVHVAISSSGKQWRLRVLLCKVGEMLSSCPPWKWPPPAPLHSLFPQAHTMCQSLPSRAYSLVGDSTIQLCKSMGSRVRKQGDPYSR